MDSKPSSTIRIRFPILPDGLLALFLPAVAYRIEWREDVPGLAASRWRPVLFGLAAAGLLLRKTAEGPSA